MRREPDTAKRTIERAKPWQLPTLKPDVNHRKTARKHGAILFEARAETRLAQLDE
jgi:hypothetical protein